MKKISKSLYDACQFLKQHPQDSATNVAKMFGVDRHSITKHLSNYLLYKYLKDDFYYYLTPDEFAPIQYYLNHPNENISSIAKQFGTKTDTIKRRLNVIGEVYERRMKRKFNRSIFHVLDSEEKAYWLGFILADGYINEDKNFLRIKLAQADEKHLQKFCLFIEEPDDVIKHDKGGSYTKNNICSFIEFDSKELIQDLISYNLHQNKSGNEQPINMPNEKMELAYLRGMIDGDGHIENGYFKYVGSLESCQYMKDKFSKWYNFNSNNKYIYEHGTIFSFEIRSKEVNDIFKNKIYKDATIYLDRKYQTVQNF